jgi:hypothetical protein
MKGDDRKTSRKDRRNKEMQKYGSEEIRKK